MIIRNPEIETRFDVMKTYHTNDQFLVVLMDLYHQKSRNDEIRL